MGRLSVFYKENISAMFFFSLNYTDVVYRAGDILDRCSFNLPVAAVSVGWLSVWHVAPETVWRTLWLPLCPLGRTG